MLTMLLAAALTAAPPAEAWKTMPLPGPMPAPARQGLANVNGIKLSFAIYGEGAPLILLHGGAGNGDHWVNQLAAFSAKYQVIVVDSRGHGRSTRDTKPITYEQMADDVLALMDELKIDKAALVGWSDGAATGLDLAIRHPERLSKLVAFATNYDLKGTQKGGGAAFATYFAQCAADYARLSPTPKDYKGLQAALRPMWRTLPNYTSAQISSIKVPTLVLDGDHDEIIRQEHVKELARLITGAKLVFIPNSSHFALFQQPAAFNQAVLEFLARADVTEDTRGR
jgi:pimeloyl-ACP methyl ester carboxylesterase